MGLQFGRQVKSRPDQGVADLRPSKGALRIGLAGKRTVALKLGDIGVYRPVDALYIALRIAQRPLRHPVIGRDDLQALPFLHFEHGR